MIDLNIMNESETIYLDYHATTPCDPRVSEVVQQTLREEFGNPSSPHIFGKRAREKIEAAREVIADNIGALSGEIVFTGCATESNNIALQGIVKGISGDVGSSSKPNIVVSAIEHKSVLKSADNISDGVEVRYAPVKRHGVVDVEALADMVDEDTIVISVQAANNELGTIQPVPTIAEIASAYNTVFHCDAVQALGRLNIDVKGWGVDLLSLSAHKAYGPKGIGLLYVRGGSAAVPIQPMMYGGGQEDGLRPGTQNVPGIVGFARACEIVDECLGEEQEKFARLRDYFEYLLTSTVSEIEILAQDSPRLASTTNIRFYNTETEALIARLPEIAVSTGSACESGAPEPSHVLEKIGLSREGAYECLRVAVGRFTSRDDVERAVELISEQVRELREVVQ